MLYSIKSFGTHKKLQEIILAVIFILLASALAYRLVFYPTAQLVPFLALALAAIFIIRRPVYGTALYLITYPMVPSSGSINMMKLATLLLTLFLFAIWLWQKLRTRDYAWRRPEYRWMFIFFVYLCFSPFLGTQNGFSVMDWARDIAPLLNLLLVPMLVEQINEGRNPWLLKYCFIIPIIISILRDLIYLASRYLPIPFNPLAFFSYSPSTFHIAVIFCVGLMLFIYKIKPKYFWLAAALLTLAYTALTITRTVWISVAFTMAQMMAFFTKYRRLSLGFIALCLVAVGWLYFLPSEQSVSLKSHETQGSWLKMQTERIYGARHRDIAVMNRNAEFTQARDKFLSSPIYGMGFGYIYHFWRYHVSKLGGSGFWDSNYTHNDIINILAKGGLIGFILWALMIWGFLRLFYEKRKMNKGKPEALLPTIGIVAIFNSIFVGSSTPVYQDRNAMFFLAVILSVCMSHISIKTLKNKNHVINNNSKL